MTPRLASSAESEQRLILLSAGTAARRSVHAAAAARLSEHVDWRRLTETLRARRLLTVLGPRILELADAEESEHLRNSVAGALAEGRRQGLFLGLISTRIASALTAAGIASAPLKGPQLGERIYGDPGRRPSSDIDLLVHPEELYEAVGVVEALGYAPPADHLDARGLPVLHLVLLHERGELPPVELHWRIHWYERSFASERLLPALEDTAPRWQPAPADELAALLLFYARDGFVDLRLAADLGAWWDTYGPQLTPGALAGISRAYPQLARALAASAHVAERVVGLPGEWLLPGSEGRLGLRGTGATRLANPNPRSTRAQLYAEIGMVDGLLTPPGELRAFMRRQVLPPRDVLAQRAGAAAGQHSTRLGHALRVLARYGLGLRRLARRPQALEIA